MNLTRSRKEALYYKRCRYLKVTAVLTEAQTSKSHWKFRGRIWQVSSLFTASVDNASIDPLLHILRDIMPLTISLNMHVMKL